MVFRGIAADSRCLPSPRTGPGGSRKDQEMIPERSASPSTDGIQKWITAARGGDRDALGQAIQACRRYLLTAAEHDLAPDLRAKEGASDLVQETLCEAYRDFQRFEGQTEVELRAWLRRLLAFQVAHAARRYRGTKMRKLRREVPIDT